MYERKKHIFNMKDYQRITRHVMSTGDPRRALSFLTYFEVLWTIYCEIVLDQMHDYYQEVYLLGRILSGIIYRIVAKVTQYGENALTFIAAALKNAANSIIPY